MAYYRKNQKGVDHEFDKYLNIFSEFDFGYVEYDCNFFCPECRNVNKCEAYKEIEEAWDTFYI